MFGKYKFAHSFLSIIIILTMTLSGVQPLSVSAQGQGDGIKREVNAETGKVSFIAPESGEVLSASQALGANLVERSSNPAMALAERFAPEFGVNNPKQDLTSMRSTETDDGRVTVRYQQNYQGIPVMGGELIVNTNEAGDLYSMNGEVSQNLSLQTQPTIEPGQASDTALQAMAKWYQAMTKDFAVSTPELWIFDESLLQPSTRPAELVWRMEVTAKDESLPVRELVLVNAQKGGISLHFNQIDDTWETTEKTALEVTNPKAATRKTVDLKPTISTTKLTKDFMPTLLGATWYVATTGNDSNSCSATGSPCLTINGAIGKATAGDTIFVAIGTYTGTGTEVVLINKSITLSGGWNVGFTTQSGMSTIDGQMTREGISTVDSPTFIVDRFIIQNGYSDSGGGIGSAGIMTLNNSVVRGNISTISAGGGIGNSGTLTLNNSTVSNNSAPGSLVNSWGGGGIYNSGSLTINNTTISGNTTGARGGGIINYSGTVLVYNSTISNNRSSSYGGGIYNNSGSIPSANVTIKEYHLS